MITIPTIGTGELREYQQTVLLDGSYYTVKLSWNARVDHWMVSLYAADGTAVVEGRMVVNGVNLLRGCTTSTRPPGVLVAVPLDSRDVHAGLTDLGNRVALNYAEEADL